MNDDDELSDADRDLFRQAVKGARPLKPVDRVAKPSSPKQTPIIPEPLAKQQTIPDNFSENSTRFTAEDRIEFVRSGLQRRQLKRLRAGQLAIEGRLDLHGYTSEQAHRLCHDFIEQQVNHGKRHVLIIHGKGLRANRNVALLKSKLFVWLQDNPAILAFCSAQPKDGGTGAMYVLLKRT